MTRSRSTSPSRRKQADSPCSRANSARGRDDRQASASREECREKVAAHLRTLAETMGVPRVSVYCLLAHCIGSGTTPSRQHKCPCPQCIKSRPKSQYTLPPDYDPWRDEIPSLDGWGEADAALALENWMQSLWPKVGRALQEGDHQSARALFAGALGLSDPPEPDACSTPQSAREGKQPKVSSVESSQPPSGRDCNKGNVPRRHGVSSE